MTRDAMRDLIRDVTSCMTRLSTTIAFAVALLMLSSRVATAQPSEHRSFSVYFENDFLLGGRSDSS